MQTFTVRVHPSADQLPLKQQLAWAIAAFAAGKPAIGAEVSTMVSHRVADSLAVALAAIDRGPVRAARQMGLAHPRLRGARVFGFDVPVHAEWAAWANGVAVRELDWNDTFLAADFAHPSDCIAALHAVAMETGRTGAQLTAAIAVAYEVHVALVKAIDLHSHKIDHVAHLAAGITAGLGTLLDLPTEIIYAALNQAIHLSFATRQSRKGDISSWKAYAPAWAGKTAIEATDRAMRGQGGPNPIYEGADSVIAWMLDGPKGEYEIALPKLGEEPRGILETYPKAHSAEYQAQAMIDLAFELRGRFDPQLVSDILIYTSDHTHRVIGSGANDPQKYDPKASRETLDHSLPYIFAVALEDGDWDHVASYTPERAARQDTHRLWSAITTAEELHWTARYHAADPAERAFGGRVEVTLEGGSVIEEEKVVADAHPNGAAPWSAPQYKAKLARLAAPHLDSAAIEALWQACDGLSGLDAYGLRALNPLIPALAEEPRTSGIFDWTS
ncbi:MAG: MmgE/PrpD family protein [Alphaproteobacteria bacterium]